VSPSKTEASPKVSSPGSGPAGTVTVWEVSEFVKVNFVPTATPSRQISHTLSVPSALHRLVGRRQDGLARDTSVDDRHRDVAGGEIGRGSVGCSDWWPLRPSRNPSWRLVDNKAGVGPQHDLTGGAGTAHAVEHLGEKTGLPTEWELPPRSRTPTTSLVAAMK